VASEGRTTPSVHTALSVRYALTTMSCRRLSPEMPFSSAHRCARGEWAGLVPQERRPHRHRCAPAPPPRAPHLVLPVLTAGSLFCILLPLCRDASGQFSLLPQRVRLQLRHACGRAFCESRRLQLRLRLRGSTRRPVLPCLLVTGARLPASFGLLSRAGLRDAAFGPSAACVRASGARPQRGARCQRSRGRRAAPPGGCCASPVAAGAPRAPEAGAAASMECGACFESI